MGGLDTDDHWEKWGQRSPYFGVLVDPTFTDVAQGDDAWTDFMATGDQHVDRLLARLENLGLPTRFERALDFGCGVGRLLAPFAQHSDESVGVDVSPSMRDEARRNLDALNISNAVVVDSDDTLSSVPGTFDLVHSYNVLQHIPPGRGLAITQRLLELTRPGGVIVLHYCNSAPALKHRIKRLTRRAPILVAGARRVTGRDPNAPVMQMFPYRTDAVLELLRSRGVTDVNLELVDYKRSSFFQVFARVPE